MISFNSRSFKLNLLNLIRQRLESIEIRNPNLAHSLCKIIPARCPFEREVKLFQRTIFRIPPLCKLNPLYEQVVSLRFKCLCYLADECGENITVYC
ncbi:Mo-dependent nitrogenase C-terminal domain-containing protein [Tolypothrix sp. VBCCA 56010]|uniref:Mo-dependent nitrogenase C-terminal domain-containing protein n=1 Tax=Tolypothrix sp. VBCCA 56010 TaxID=3137731 RepID=UPI003D7D8A1A